MESPYTTLCFFEPLPPLETYGQRTTLMWAVASLWGGGGWGAPPLIPSRGWHPDESLIFLRMAELTIAWRNDHLEGERVGVVKGLKTSSFLRSTVFLAKIGRHHQLPHGLTPTLVTPLHRGSLETAYGLPISVISVNWTVFTRCYGWGATSEYRLKIGVFAPTGSVWPKISGRRVTPPTILFVRKLGWMIFYVVYVGKSFFRFFVTMHAFDRQTDRKAFAIPCVALGQHAVKRLFFLNCIYLSTQIHTVTNSRKQKCGNRTERLK